MIQSREESEASGGDKATSVPDLTHGIFERRYSEEHSRLYEKPTANAENDGGSLTDEGLDDEVEEENVQTGKEDVAGNRTMLTKSISMASLTTAQLKMGTLNTAKSMEGGKRLRVKWSNVYVTLHESGLTFRKSSSAKKTAQEEISLLGAQLQRATDKEYRKRNVIQLTTAESDCYLLQSDIDVNIAQWYEHIHEAIEAQSPTGERIYKNVIIDGLGPTKPAGCPREERTPPARSRTEPSMDRTNIREMLRKLILKRPPRQYLRDRGIIKDQVFGCPLQSLCAREASTVPAFVRLCVQEVDKRGLQVDGIYRLSGNLASVQKLRYAIDREDKLDLGTDSPWADIHVVSGALKLFFRELPESLIPQKNFGDFVKALGMNNCQARTYAIGELINSLAGPHLETMKFLFGHLKRVAKHRDANRMSVENLAIVFGPTLLRSEMNSPQSAMNDMPHQAQVLEFILGQFSTLFPE
ncbi:rho GTPase-activating protein 15-like isoform X2 [Petromyzon marinus]|uniref:Rho GTPase-activating protein 15-like isoform X2 n=1 Tax=Petromyzon marinus TaxID=7757 RepID=A0AAJ7TS35_PETMA|nr:rho GTPase-activating protein 15-like isoform X2 [Petromyzon marinus]